MSALEHHSATEHAARRQPVGLRTLAVATPPVVAALAVWHPIDPADAMDLADTATTWIWLHVGLLIALPMLAATVWWLVEPIHGRAASVARATLLPALTFYAAFDSLVGIGTGLLVQHTAAMDLSTNESARALVDQWWNVPPAVALISSIAQAAWVAAFGAATIAHVNARSPRAVVAALTVATVTFPLLHFRPVGLVSMAALLTAVLLVRRAQP